MHVEFAKSTSIVDLQHHQILAIKTCGVYNISQIHPTHFSFQVYSAKSLFPIDLSTSIHSTVDYACKLTFPLNAKVLKFERLTLAKSSTAFDLLHYTSRPSIPYSSFHWPKPFHRKSGRCKCNKSHSKL